MLRFDSEERRRRLAVRHHLAPAAADALDVARSLVCLHSTDPSSVHLAAWARVDGFERAELDALLYDERRIVKHMAMRRTVWAVPRESLGAVQCAASDRVAGAERRRLVKDVEGAGIHADGSGWLDAARAEVLAMLGSGRESTSSELREECATLHGATPYGVGRSWGRDMPIGPRVLTVLSAEGSICRGPNDGGWYVSRPRWVATERWLGAPIERMEPAAATRDLVEQWLRRFGPGSTEDITWWLGGTLRAVRRALIELGAIAVELDGERGWLLPDDLDPTPEPDPWVALLPPLDPTTMGWKSRAWYVGPHASELFDSAGNGGPTAWCDGRIVGGWRQDDEGVVELRLLEDVGARRRRELEAEAERLTEWCEGRRAMIRQPSPLWRRVDAGTA